MGEPDRVTRRLPAPWFIVLPLLLLALWHFAVERQWVAAGIIPSPAQVVQSWYTWIFGSSKAMLSPYAGTWLDNVAYSTRRVLQGFCLAALVAIPLGLRPHGDLDRKSIPAIPPSSTGPPATQ